MVGLATLYAESLYSTKSFTSFSSSASLVSFIVSNMRSSGENVELRIVSERQPAAGAENVESTLEDAYLYLTQIAGGEKNATL